MLPYVMYHELEAVRAENSIAPGQLPIYERKGWWAQVKKNGTYNLIYVPPKRDRLIATTRRHEDHKAWSWTEHSSRVFRSIPGDKWWVFCAELLHSKFGGVRDTNYVHDVLVAEGDYLVGKTYAERYKVLQDVFLTRATPHGTMDHWVVDENTWLARNIRENFIEVFREKLGPPGEDEGLVLKDPRGKLTLTNNQGWTVKCRQPKSTQYGW